MMSPPINNVYGNNIDPRAGLPLTLPEPLPQGVRGLLGARIPNGALVEGAVVGFENGLYQVKVGGQTLSAASNLPLFVGQHFKAIWDSSGDIPTLRLQPQQLALLSKFIAREQPLAFALLSRGLPVTDDVMIPLQQAMARMGGNEKHLPAVIELWARNQPLTGDNINLLTWYMNIGGEEASSYWKKLRERLRGDKKNASVGDWKGVISEAKSSSDDLGKFLQAHSLLSKSARSGIDPTAALASQWWPWGEEDEISYAKVSSSKEEDGGREVWRINFEVEGKALGEIKGDMMTNKTSLSIDLSVQTLIAARFMRQHLPLLERELSDVPLKVQHIGLGLIKQKAPAPSRIVDVEA